MTLPKEILLRLIEAYNKDELDNSITADMLSFLAKALEPPLNRYIIKHGMFPEPKIFQAIVNNFVQDGPRVQILMAVDRSEAFELWNQVREALLDTAARNWGDIDLVDREEIVDRAFVRIQRYLENFLFQARFSTWMFKILKHEYLRLVKKIKAEQEQQISIDEEIGEGTVRGEILLSSNPGPEVVAEQNQVIKELWDRLGSLGNTMDVKILRLHLHRYTLSEIKENLGLNAPSIATIKRRKDRLLERMKADSVIREIAQHWGILDDKDDD